MTLNDSRSFRLPIATEKGDWFYPDFIDQHKDGRLFVLEYKGDLTGQLAETQEKDAIGKLWAAQDKSKYVYATIYKKKDGKGVGQQIDAALEVSGVGLAGDSVNLPRIYDRKDKPDAGAVNIADWLKEFPADCGAREYPGMAKKK